MANTNLQQVCHRVFLGRSQDFPFYRGLLRGARGRLRKLLFKCAGRRRLLEDNVEKREARMERTIRRFIERELKNLER